MRPLSATLAAAWEAARPAGVTRLGDVTELGGLGVPTFQAVRPWSRSLSVSQGKGLTPLAAMTGALLEAVELDAAEGLATPAGAPEPLAVRAAVDRATWAETERDPLAVRLDPERPHLWTTGVDLFTNRPAALPFELAALDFTRPNAPDLWRSTVGLATGNTRDEALAGALAELIEQDALARFDRLSPSERRRLQLDLASVDDPLCRALALRLERHGFSVRAWSIGQTADVPVFYCAIFPANGRSPGPGPMSGSGCHPSRGVALLRALLEAAQTRATVVAGARDDLGPRDYRDGERRQMDLLVASLAFGPGPLAWAAVAERPAADAAEETAVLRDAARRLSPLPVIALDLPEPHPSLRIVRAVAPGLLAPQRARGNRPPPPTPPRTSSKRRRAPVLFAGPSLQPWIAPVGVELRGPAVCGDLLALLDDPPAAVGLADGCFEIAPTVWHKEVLLLLAAGVRVLGGASLGAIRAAELSPFGMEGVGVVHALYATGAVRRDDAAMMAHAPAELGWRALTVALVDAEAALLATPMPPAERRALQRAARTIHYSERTWAACLRRCAELTGALPSATEAQLAAAPSIKIYDARLLVAALLRHKPPPRAPVPPATVYLRRLMAATRG